LIPSVHPSHIPQTIAGAITTTQNESTTAKKGRIRVTAASTSDVRALQKTSGTDRLAATWYGGAFSVDVNVTDGLVHQLALYVVDWDAFNRVERLEIHDAVTDALLDSRTVSGFHNGQYWRWNIGGHVKVRVIGLEGVNALLWRYFRVRGRVYTREKPTRENWHSSIARAASSPAILLYPITASPLINGNFSVPRRILSLLLNSVTPSSPSP